MSSPRIINLILYSPGECYDMMIAPISSYLKRKGIEHYFYSYVEDLQEEFVFRDSHLLLRGKESVIPGVMAKTIAALRAVDSKDYDVIVRTNISTLVDFDELAKHMSVGVDYSGLMNYNMTLDVNHGLTADKLALYRDHHWAFGVCILLSKKAARMLIADEQLILDFGVVDDQVMGIYFHQRQQDVVRGAIPWNTWAHNAKHRINGIVVYRNKSDDRCKDVLHIRAIAKTLS